MYDGDFSEKQNNYDQQVFIDLSGLLGTGVGFIQL